VSPFFRRLLSVAALLLTACAAPALRVGDGMQPRTAVRDFSLDARFSVTQAAERHSGRLSWQHRDGGDELQIASPFGQIVAEISVDRRRARLVAADQRVFEAADVQQLTEEVLGYRLPVNRLADWVLARRRDAAGVAVAADAAGRPQAISDDGWQITYEYDQDGADALPSRLFATRPGGPELRLRIEEWRTP
jgi:outer membrane lipoprotein LolB